MRSIARECILKYLYAEFFNQQDKELFAMLLQNNKLNEQDKEFANNLLDKIEENKQKYIDKLNELSIGYKLERVFVLDKCAILIGMAELEFNTSTDVPVIVDEAVGLASKFSTERSTTFVNGILAEYAKEVRHG